MIILALALGLTNYLVIADVPTRILELVQAHIESPNRVSPRAECVPHRGRGADGHLLGDRGRRPAAAALRRRVSASIPLHLAVIFLANMELGYLMPPMGENLFLSSSRFNRPLTEIYRSTLPYTGMLLAATLIITFVPGLSLWLVDCWRESAISDDRRGYTPGQWPRAGAVCDDALERGAGGVGRRLPCRRRGPRQTLRNLLVSPLRHTCAGVDMTCRDAEDLTQAFFAHLLEKKVLRHADPSRGRFRSFLLTSLKNSAANARDRQLAKKRAPGRCRSCPLDVVIAEERYLLEPATGETPERVFDRRWALALLDCVISRLASRTRRPPDAERHFDRLKTVPDRRAAAGQLCRSGGGAGDVRNGRQDRPCIGCAAGFGALVYEEVSHTVASPDEVESEIRHLWSAVAADAPLV